MAFRKSGRRLRQISLRHRKTMRATHAKALATAITALVSPELLHV